MKTPRPEPTPGRIQQTDDLRSYYGWMIVGIIISLPIGLIAMVWLVAQAVRLAMAWGWLP